MEDAVVEVIHKSALTGVSSKPLLCTATGLGPAARGNPMSNCRDTPHSPDPRVSPGAGFEQTRRASSHGGDAGVRGVKLRSGLVPSAQVPTTLL